MKKNLLTLSLLLAGALTAGAQVTKSISGHQTRTAPQQMVRVNAATPQNNTAMAKDPVVYTGTPAKMLNKVIRKADEKVTLEAAYDVPEASYYWGMTAGWRGYSVGILQSSAHVFNKFRNYSDYDETQPVTFSWELPLSSGTIELDQDENGNAVDSVKWGYYPAPILTVKQGGEEASWNLGERGTENKSGYWYLGTDSLTMLSHAAYAFGLYSGFSNLDKRYETNSDFDGQKVVGFGEYFDKPASATYVTSIDMIGWLDESKNINDPLGDNELKAEIYTIDDEGNLSEEPYATAIATSANYELVNVSNGNIGLTFVFYTEDDLFGMVESSIMLPDERFMILFTGFENLSGNFIVPFCPAGGFVGHSYVILEDGSLSTIGYGNYPNTPQVDLHISLNAALATINLEDPEQKIILPEEGGYAYYEVEDEEGLHHYSNIFLECNVLLNEKNEDQPWQIEETPEWITGLSIDDKYQDQYWVVELYIEGEALPEGVEGRKGDVVISVYGRKLVIPVTQGVVDNNPVKEITDGKWYIRNVATKKFWGAGNTWGTQASLVDEYQYVTLAKQPEGAYTMETMVSNGGTSYYFGGDYMDGNPVNLTIAPAENGYFTVANAAGELYGYDGESTVLGKNIAAGENTLWEFLTEEEIVAEQDALIANAVATATVENPVDMTLLLIKDANFGRNRRDAGEAWTNEGANNLAGGGDNGNGCAEAYHAAFTVSQLLSKAPKGVYKLTAQGFYRQDGSDNDNLPYVFANDAKSYLPVKTGTENSMTDAGASFKNGLYNVEPIYVEVAEDGALTVGVKLEVNTTLWCIWDNFQLTYYGKDADVNALQNAALMETLANLRQQATDLQDKVDNEVVKAALADALASTASVNASSDPADVQAAIETLTAAVALGEANVTAQNVLPAMKALVDATNVYTEEALNEYYTQWNDKYQAGTLTKDEANALQNPEVVTGWHAAITVDNFLLSAWDTNPDFNNAPYYINTWSVEGDTDGSNFRVPFFEYWTGDGDSLGERTLTATLNGVEEGEYEASAWVRVRAKNGYEAPAYGITLQVNDGEPVDVAAGDQVGTSQFFLNNFAAKGNANGELKIKFNVAADNNISWLSFKNVKYTRLGVINGISTVNTNQQNNTIYNLNGQKVQKAKSGLYIINGKKVVK